MSLRTRELRRDPVPLRGRSVIAVNLENTLHCELNEVLVALPKIAEH
jgi:hypothetical protein